MNNMEWRNIEGFSKYQVSEYGDVRRVRPFIRRSGKPSNKKIPFILSKCANKNGYYNYLLSNDAGKIVNFKAHRLVALAFLDPPQNDSRRYVAHNDGDKKNNHYSNLRWATAKENSGDMVKHGTRTRGESVHTAIVTEDEVIRIRIDAKNDKVQYGRNVRIAKKYGISVASVKCILTGRSWAHV